MAHTMYYEFTDLFLERAALWPPPARALEALPAAKLGLEVAARAGEARRQTSLGGLTRSANG